MWPSSSSCLHWVTHSALLTHCSWEATEQSKHICESVGSLTTSEQTDFMGNAADKTMMGCHIKPQDWPISRRQKFQEHGAIISLHSSYPDSTWQESEGEKYFEPKRQGESAIYCNISSYIKHCSMLFFQKRLKRQWENTPRSPLPLLPSGTNIEPDKPQEPGSSPKFSLQWSWALESCTIHLPLTTTGRGI